MLVGLGWPGQGEGGPALNVASAGDHWRSGRGQPR